MLLFFFYSLVARKESLLYIRIYIVLSVFDCKSGWVVLPYSGLFPWGANFRYFRGSPGGSRNFPPMKIFATHCVSLSTRAQIWTGDVLVWLFFATCSALGPPSPLSQAVPRMRTEEVNREV